MPQISEINELSSSFLIDESQYKITETENIITLPSTYLHKTKVSTSNSSLDKNHKMASFMTQHSDPTTKTFAKSSYHP